MGCVTETIWIRGTDDRVAGGGGGREKGRRKQQTRKKRPQKQKGGKVLPSCDESRNLCDFFRDGVFAWCPNLDTKKTFFTT